MKRTLTTICLVFLCTTFSFAQEKLSKNLFYGDLTYGFETNYGNTGFLTGIGYQRTLSKKFIFQTDIHYFNTGVIKHNWQYEKEFPKEERYDRSAFLSGWLGYAVIGKTNKFNITVKAGLSICHIKSKNMFTYQGIFYPEGNTIPNPDPGYFLKENYIIQGSTIIYGTGVVTPSSIRYYNENKFGAGYNFGLDVNIPIKKKHFLTIGFISISQENPLQYFFCPIPVISYKFKLLK
jgi:hypothetical protein